MSEPLPSPPFVDVPGIYNFRVLQGPSLGPGLVYRSADPSKVTGDGLVKMRQELGITTIFDLRSKPEIERHGPEWSGVPAEQALDKTFSSADIQRVWVPVFAAEDYGPEQVALRYKMYTREGGPEGFVQAYHDILNAAGPAYSKILKHLAQTEEGKVTPCLVHCTAGKDRTGLLAALLLLLVGASADEIAEEYSLTDQGLAPLKPLFKERLLKNPALQGNVSGVEEMVSSKKQNMTATLVMLEKKFGGVRRYLREYCGLEPTEIEQLKNNLERGYIKTV